MELGHLGNRKGSVRTRAYREMIEASSEFSVECYISTWSIGFCFKKWRRMIQGYGSWIAQFELEAPYHVVDIANLIAKDHTIAAFDVDAKEGRYITLVRNSELTP